MAHRYRLAPTESEVGVLSRHCADARFVWNLALEQANLYRKHWGATPNDAVRSRQLTEARAGTWLGEGSAVIQQQALRDFDQAMRYWWRGSHGRPTWRTKGTNESFCVRDVRVRQLNGRWAALSIPKLGYVKFRLSRPLPAEYGMATVTLDRAGRWHVSFNAPQPIFERTATGESVGIDVGITHTLTLSTGAHVDMPTLLSPGERQRKLRLQRRLARQRKGSNRRGRTRQSIARIAAREVDRRKDWIEKTTTGLVRRFDVIAVEDLKIAKMVRSAKGTVENPGTNVAQKTGLNRAIHGQAWGMFRTRLEQKAAAATAPCEVIRINPAFTSQRCNQCGHTASENRESQAVFRCVECGHTVNADVNAGLNIKAAGLAVSGRGGRHSAVETSTTRRDRQHAA